MATTFRRLNADLVYRVGSYPTVKKLFRFWYPYLSRRLRSEDVNFFNWGYEEDPPMQLALNASDEPNRYCIQLYHRTAAQQDLTGSDVLEVSCGHGGGASYVTRTMKPGRYTGLDLNADGVQHCSATHVLPGLSFVEGDAEKLPFDDQQFDAVLNVEASHIYPDFPCFLAEVVRVLRPGGHFLYTDMRNRLAIAEWESDLANSPLRLVSQTEINAEVLRGLTKNSAQTSDLVRSHLPRIARRFGNEFAVVEGSLFYEGLREGTISYRVYHFIKD